VAIANLYPRSAARAVGRLRRALA